MSLVAVPITLREANVFVRDHHRHSRPTEGGKFAIGAVAQDVLVGVAIVGRPIARRLDDGMTAEVRRLCVLPDAPKGTCSFLYARCWRAWSAMGGVRMVTYTLASESGASLRGAGWRSIGAAPPNAKGWDMPSRRRAYYPVYGQQKLRWEVGSPAAPQGGAPTAEGDRE